MTCGQDCVSLGEKSSAMSVNSSLIKRAETADQKIAKGEFILAAAHDMIVRDGIQGLSMNKLCAACDVGKGTLYLYFKTRTEILAALFVQKLGAWANRMDAALSANMDFDQFCMAYLECIKSDPVLIDLLGIAARDFGTELPNDTYHETLAHLNHTLENQADQFSNALALDAATASGLVWAFYTAALGASAHHTQNVSIDLPAQLGQFHAALQFDRLFLNAVALYRRG